MLTPSPKIDQNKRFIRHNSQLMPAWLTFGNFPDLTFCRIFCLIRKILFEKHPTGNEASRPSAFFKRRGESVVKFSAVSFRCQRNSAVEIEEKNVEHVWEKERRSAALR